MFNLPGSVYHPKPGSVCDEHQDRPAVKKVQGETDSFGCEFLHMCQECYDAFRSAPDPMTTGQCDWCKSESTVLAPTRDYDEGTHGPVYYVCYPCREKQNEAARRELADLDDPDDYLD